ncbi:MAG: hypothetical protein KKH44_07710 [Bacteroidetes bacterium]|nr:hypothetical protein [Bacteroidota bacterium]
MERVYLDTSGLPNSIPVRSELPNSIYVDASDLQRVLENFTQQLPYALEEALKTNRAETLVSQKFTEEKAIKIFRWLLGYESFPDKKEGDPNYYWRSHLRAFLNEIGITKEVLEDSKFSG